MQCNGPLMTRVSSRFSSLRLTGHLGAGILLALALTGAARAEWLQREAAIMGTRCVVELWSDDRAQGEAAIEAVFAEMRRIDALMSTYKADSELSRLNATAGSRAVQVSRELFDLLATSLEYSRTTGGAFDITYASVGYLYDYRRHVHPDRRALSAALPAIDYRRVRLDPARLTVRFELPGVRVDLGGIAKGHAVDRGIELLRAHGIERAMVNAGGDTRIIGDRFGRPWITGIRHPDDERRVILRIPITDAALSTSGDYERFFEEGGVRYHHILDPKTGDSARRLRSVTIIGPSATRTDALSTSVFVLGPEAGIELVDGLEDVDAVVVTPEGRVLYSRGLEPPGGG